jgi:hypothetical protein
MGVRAIFAPGKKGLLSGRASKLASNMFSVHTFYFIFPLYPHLFFSLSGDACNL